MKNALLVTLFLTSLIVGCNKSDSASGSNNNLNTINQAEADGDLTHLNQTEKSLETVGLQFESKTETQNGVVTTTYKWNSSFLNNFYYKSAPTSYDSTINLLETYVKEANAYIAKYSSAVNIKNQDGSTQPMQLKESVKNEIEAKVRLVNKTLESLKKS